MHRARILQKDRTSALQCIDRVYYRQTERVRILQNNVTIHRARILQKDGTSAYITEQRYKAERYKLERVQFKSRKNDADYRAEK